MVRFCPASMRIAAASTMLALGIAAASAQTAYPNRPIGRGDKADQLGVRNARMPRAGVLGHVNASALVAGSGLRFNERGRHSLKGLQEQMDLYAALN